MLFVLHPLKKRIDAIEGWKKIFKLYGVRKALQYSFDGSLEKRIREYGRNKMENALLGLLAQTAMDDGVGSAINWLNSSLWREYLSFTKEELQFFSQYFAEEEAAAENVQQTQSQFNALMEFVPAYAKLVLSGKSSKAILELIKEKANSSDKVMCLLYFLVDNHLRDLFEKYNTEFDYPLRRECSSIERPHIKRKLLKELGFINTKVKAFLFSGRFDSRADSEFVRILGQIGIENARFFEKLVVSLNTEDGVRNAAYAFWLQIRGGRLDLADFARLFRRISTRYYGTRDRAVQKQLIVFAEETVQKFIIEPHVLPINAVPVLKRYGKFLKGIIKHGGIVADTILPYIGDLFEGKTAEEMLFLIVERAKNLETKSKAFNALIIFSSRSRNLGWPFTSHFNKKGIKPGALRKLRVYSLYRNSAKNLLVKDLDEAYEQGRSLPEFLSICPEVSLKLLMAHYSKVNGKFLALDKQYNNEKRTVEANFKKMLSKYTSIPERKRIVESMDGKIYCYPQWRTYKSQLEKLDSLRKLIEDEMKSYCQEQEKLSPETK